MESSPYVGMLGKRSAQSDSQTVTNNSLMAVYSCHSDAAAGVRELEKAGFQVTYLSIAGKLDDTQMDFASRRKSDDHPRKGRSQETASGYPSELLAASTSVGVAGIGPVLLAGPLAAMISANSENGNTLELSVISAGLYSLGIPMSTILRHETSLQTDKVLLLTDGAATELIRAKEILRSTRPEEMHLHFGDEIKVKHA
jgi:hypothetical protein